MVDASILWLRRDLRRQDLPSLTAAHRAAGPAGVVPVFVVDPRLWRSAGGPRRAWLAATLKATDEAYDGRLVLRVGDPRRVIPKLAAAVGARSVHISRETTPYGRRRDRQVATTLAERGVELVPTGTPYAVGPGSVRKGDGEPYRVFTPFARAWREHGWPRPEQRVTTPRWLEVDDDLEAVRMVDQAANGSESAGLPVPGEAGARETWQRFLATGLAAYDVDRDRPDREGTSRLSPYLKLGVVHPRTLLADLAPRLAQHGGNAERFVTELAWREFYADVLWHHPSSAWTDLRESLSGLRYDDPRDAIHAWQAGRTGYPLVDAGMRQLLETGWMHNRLRMVTASFLTKDLHVWWPVGARHFLQHLIDGDLASNNHGWQWVAGTGTDAAPYFRVFNPTAQGERFDPDGDYVRRWVPELRHLAGSAVHRPWRAPDGYAHDYPRRLVDHAEERREALRRYQGARA
jgi:deoxyribodipyrimidine photo-lyase